MVFKRFSFNVIVRILILFASLLGLAVVIVLELRIFSILVLIAFIIIQLFSLLIYINKTNRDLTRFLLAIKHDDMTISYPDTVLGNKFDELHEAYTSILGLIKDAKIKKEAQYYYLKKIIENTRAGIIALDENNNIELINKSASGILNLPRIDNWEKLKNHVPEFTKEVEKVRHSGKRLIKFVLKDSLLELSLQINTIKILGNYIRLITFQNIGLEIEHKEIEAWQKLIRTIAHEIMNSVTPISSLTETGISLLEDEKGSQRSISDLNNKDISSIRTALKTIGKRSEGLYDFVDDYRKMAKISDPQKSRFIVLNLVERINSLLGPQFSKNNIDFSYIITPPGLKLSADENQIEQVLINLLNNSISAVNSRSNPKILIKAQKENDGLIIKLSDNGPGISMNKIDKIFVPFYTTKDSGSGIGLSLSRQIMQLHGGSISVISKPDVETCFTLKFTT